MLTVLFLQLNRNSHLKKKKKRKPDKSLQWERREEKGEAETVVGCNDFFLRSQMIKADLEHPPSTK